ncbi:MAG: DNA repair protein RecO [Muribaculaceae bacterium]|nr:DNA repair protein RecO [Muribaculaceae bacterium]
MVETLHGIVLNVVKYNDRHHIARIYTRERGMMSFLVQQGNTPAARQRRALFMPLSPIAFEAHLTPQRDIHSLHGTRRTAVPVSISSEPTKTTIALFLGELLSRVIIEQERNEPLYDFLEASIDLLENATRGVANFHICFLYHLGQFIGIQPDTGSYAPERWFDMDEGTFTTAVPSTHRGLPPEQARVIHLLSRMTFANMHLFRFNHHERNAMLDTILSYYRLHHSALGAMRSPDVLKQLFA